GEAVLPVRDAQGGRERQGGIGVGGGAGGAGVIDQRRRGRRPRDRRVREERPERLLVLGDGPRCRQSQLVVLIPRRLRQGNPSRGVSDRGVEHLAHVGRAEGRSDIGLVGSDGEVV